VAPAGNRILGVAVAAAVLAVSACGAPATDDSENAGRSVVNGSTVRPRPTATDGAAVTEPTRAPTTAGPSTTVAAPESTTSTTSTTSPPPPTTATTAAPPPPPLEQGDDGEPVAALQRRLTELGYRPGEPDGHYGGQTWSAVLAFQKREGLGRDGVAGPLTLERLAAPVGAGPRRSGPGPWIEVDITRQVVFVADAGGAVTTLNTSTGSGRAYTSSTGGRAIARTPRGSYTVTKTVNGTERGRLGTLYRPMYFTGGYALHGSPSVPAYPASHGCVRLANADADWLWTVAGKGTPVDVYD
jgi:peptidoglycan hydrolase-like protein with peptidoglycan-binding domain